MTKRGQGATCYFCGKRAVGVEHAPPKLMFRGFPCDRITVPSCETHNTGKGGSDQAIVSALLIPLDNNRHRHHYQPDVLRAIDITRTSFERSKRKAISSSLVRNSPIIEALMPKVSHLASSVNMGTWIKQLTAAVLWDALQKHELRIDWGRAACWSAEWMNSPMPSAFEPEEVGRILMEQNLQKAKLQSLNWESGWSACPRPYPPTLYQFAIYLGTPHELAFRHTFYGSYTWYVYLRTPAGIHKKILRRIEKGHPTLIRRCS